MGWKADAGYCLDLGTRTIEMIRCNMTGGIFLGTVDRGIELLLLIKFWANGKVYMIHLCCLLKKFQAVSLFYILLRNCCVRSEIFWWELLELGYI